MWVVREALRITAQIAVAVLIAVAIAALRAAVSGADTLHTFKIVLLLLGCLLLLLAGAGSKVGAQKATSSGWWLSDSHAVGRALGNAPGPRLAPAAVFVGSAAVLIALGVLL